MSGLIYDEQSLVDNQIYKYDKFLHTRLNRYTDEGRTLVTYFNINDSDTTTSLGFNDTYQILGNDSSLRYNCIEDALLMGLTPVAPEETAASSTSVRNYNINGECFVIPGTIQPKENDMFIIKHIQMNHIFRVTQVTQDGLNVNGGYKIAYTLYSSNKCDIDQLYKQVTDYYKMDLQTIGGDDLTPVIGKTDYETRSRLISMMNDMIESYHSKYYDKTHNCYLCHLNGQTLFDLCGNAFMEKNCLMINDNSTNNVVLNRNKVSDPRLDDLYQKSPYKWIERDAPLRYLDTFKYHITKSWNYVDSSFTRYGSDVDVMIPDDAWCDSSYCDFFFPMEVYNILDNECDTRTCSIKECRCCEHRPECLTEYKLKRYDYISIIHDFVHGKLRSINDLSLYTGDQLFDNSMSREVYLWTPIVLYIIRQTLKIK